MISAIVLSPSLGAPAPSPRAAEALARSLSALVRAAVEGVLRDAAIVGAPGDALAQIADHAGCEFIVAESVGAGLTEALARARSETIMVLLGGYVMPGAFVGEVADFLMEADAFRGALLRAAPDTLLTRVAPGLARPVGLLAPRRLLPQQPRDWRELAKSVKSRRDFSFPAVRAVEA